MCGIVVQFECGIYAGSKAYAFCKLCILVSSKREGVTSLEVGYEDPCVGSTSAVFIATIGVDVQVEVVGSQLHEGCACHCRALFILAKSYR